MKDENIEYINKHFLTIKELAKESGHSVEEIQMMNVSGHLPEPSYVVTSSFCIESPLGDRYENQEIVSYYPKSLVNLIKTKREAQSEESFLDELEKHLSAHPDRIFAYGGAIEGSDELSEALNNELNAYRAGIYGICTIDATPKAVIDKEIAVKKLIAFKERIGGDLSHDEVDELEKLVDDYDAVSSLFAPYQRAESSRGKYVDALLKQSDREERIQNYE